MEKRRIKRTIDDLVKLNKSVYCDLGPGIGVIPIGLNKKGKETIAVEAMWASELNKKWAVENNIKLYIQEFFTGDFEAIKENVDCFILSHVIAHFRYSPYLLFEKVYNKLPPKGMFYVSTVNGCSFQRVLQLATGKPITGKVSKNMDKGFEEVVKDFNSTGKRQIWDDWMHTKEYTKNELEQIFIESGFKIVSSFYRNHYSSIGKTLATKIFPHLSQEIVVVGEK